MKAKKKVKKLKKDVKYVFKRIRKGDDTVEVSAALELLRLNMRHGPGAFFKIWKKLANKMRKDRYYLGSRRQFTEEGFPTPRTDA